MVFFGDRQTNSKPIYDYKKTWYQLRIVWTTSLLNCSSSQHTEIFVGKHWTSCKSIMMMKENHHKHHNSTKWKFNNSLQTTKKSWLTVVNDMKNTKRKFCLQKTMCMMMIMWVRKFFLIERTRPENNKTSKGIKYDQKKKKKWKPMCLLSVEAASIIDRQRKIRNLKQHLCIDF